MGDDTAVLPPPAAKHLLLTNDSLIWGQHFDESASPEQAGAKLVKRNLSDIAAMGGTPLHAVLALSCGDDLSLCWLERFFEGIARCSAQYRCEINGGDVTQGPSGTFGATLTLLGESNRPILRTAGQPGSSIWVTGSLGGSIQGHHLNFDPRLDEGQWLAKQSQTMALMDITDGIAQDLPKMIPDDMQAQIDPLAIPISAAAQNASIRSDRTALWHSLYDGEDYELLIITRPETDDETFLENWNTFSNLPLTRIGALRSAPEGKSPLPSVVDLDNVPLFSDHGFEHFRPQS
tara:strand:+ start:14997 stop:15869 length:873 start_codon:yes stop_codon:yes gene_type:complete